jgi:hypothetical protein
MDDEMRVQAGKQERARVMVVKGGESPRIFPGHGEIVKAAAQGPIPEGSVGCSACVSVALTGN